jgi:hypothetical protein
MNEAKPVNEPPNVTPASSPSPVPKQVSGSSIDDRLRNVSILPRSLMEPEPAPKVEPLNPTLDEGDLKLSLNVVIDGRTIRVMDCNFSTTACGGLDAKNRGLVFQSIERLTDEALQAAAIKLNRAVPLPEPSPDEMQHGDPGLSDSSVVNAARAQDGMNHLSNGSPRY